MSDQQVGGGIRARGEEAIGEVAQALLENPLFSQALEKAFGAGEKALSAQRNALGAVDIATGTDLERLERRVRSLSDRIEALEDAIDDLSRDLAAARKPSS